MEYFRHSRASDIAKVSEVFNVVQGLQGYAKTIYKSRWEDVLDMAYFHILNNFDWEGDNDLLHYATKVVGTIGLNIHAHEIEHDTQLDIAMDKKSLNTQGLTPEEVLLDEKEYSDGLEDCVSYLLPSFILDYKFFKSKKSEDRILEYKGLFKRFPEMLVAESMKVLIERYGNVVEELYQIKEKANFRNFPEDRYKASLDTSLEFEGIFKGIVLYKKTEGRMTKVFYELDIRSLLKSLYQSYYSTYATRLVGDITVYVTLSGQFLLGEEKLLETLEREVIGALLARNSFLKVAMYEKGNLMVLTSSRDLDVLVLNIFEKPFNIYLRKLTAKNCC